MSQMTADPYTAAQDLISELHAPSGTITVSTFWKEGGGLSLKVFLTPDVGYLRKNIPRRWEGFDVLCEVAERPRAYG